MKGIYDKKAILSIIEPLTDIVSLYGKSVRVVFECEPEKIYMSVKNTDETLFCICTINAKDLIKEYTIVQNEIGIWDVNNLIKVLSLFQKDFYKEDLHIDVKDACLEFSCGSDLSSFGLGDVNYIQEQRAKIRSFSVENFTECCRLTLNGDTLRKIVSKIGVFSELDIINFSAKKNKALKMKLLNSSGAIINTSETLFDSIISNEEFNMSLPKDTFKGILNSSDAIDLTIYTGEVNILCVEYNNNGYEMQVFFAEIVN